MAIESFHSKDSKVRYVFPVMFGTRTEVGLDIKVGEFKPGDYIAKVKGVNPHATLVRAAELLTKNGIQPRDQFLTRSLDVILNEVFGFLYMEAWTIKSGHVEQEIVARTVHMLDDLSTVKQAACVDGLSSPTPDLTHVSLTAASSMSMTADCTVDYPAAWDFLKSPKNSLDPDGLTSFLDGLGVLGPNDLALLDEEDISTLLGFLKKIGKKRIASFLKRCNLTHAN